MTEPVNLPRVTEVIESMIIRGNDTDDNPKRNVVRYHRPDGTYLAEFDPHTDCTIVNGHLICDPEDI